MVIHGRRKNGLILFFIPTEIYIYLILFYSLQKYHEYNETNATQKSRKRGASSANAVSSQTHESCKDKEVAVRNPVERVEQNHLNQSG